MFDNEVYIVYVDGNFCGIAEDEYEAVDLANDYVNGFTKPLLDDDMADRLYWDIININRFYCSRQTVEDKLSDNSFLCYNKTECANAVEQLNKLNLKKEKMEAKIRAMEL